MMLAAFATMIGLVSTGFLLGIGFWLSRKFTGIFDEAAVLADSRLMQELRQEQKNG